MVATKGDSSHTFCSYARVDRERVFAISELIKTSGLPLWIDTEAIEPAVDWMAEVERAIDGADAFVLFLSPAYLNSSICLAESQRAREDGKRVIPVLIGEVSNFDALPWIQDLNWIIATDTGDDQRIVDEIVRAARTDSNWANQHRELLVSARAWDQADRRKSRLLRGTDLQQAQLALGRRRMPDDPQPAEIQLEYLAASITHQTRRRRLAVILAVAVIATSSGLGILARLQANLANSEREAAAAERDRAERERQSADEQRELADAAREQADNARQVAEEQEQAALDALATAQRLQAEAEAQALVSASLNTSDPLWSALFALEALGRSAPTSKEAVEAWLKAAYELNQSTPYPAEVLVNDQGSDATLSPSGDAIYITDGTHAELVSTEGASLINDLPAGTASWSPSGHILIISSESGTTVISTSTLDRRTYSEYHLDHISWSPRGSSFLARNSDPSSETSRYSIVIVNGDLTFERVDTQVVGRTSSDFHAAWNLEGSKVAFLATATFGATRIDHLRVIDLETFDHRNLFSALLHGPIMWEKPDQDGTVLSEYILVGTSGGQVARIPLNDMMDDEALASVSGLEVLVGFELPLIQSVPRGAVITSFGDFPTTTPIVGRVDGSVWVKGAQINSRNDTRVTNILRHPSVAVSIVLFADGGISLINTGLEIPKLIGYTKHETAVPGVRGAKWGAGGRDLMINWQEGSVIRYRLDSFLPAIVAGTELGQVFRWAPNGDLLARGNSDGVVTIGAPAQSDVTEIVLDLAYLPEAECPEQQDYFCKLSVVNLEWSPDGNFLAVEYRNGALAILNYASGEVEFKFALRVTGATGVSWSPDSRYFVTLAPGEGASVFTTNFDRDDAESWTFDDPASVSDPATQARFAPDGKLVVLSHDGRLTATTALGVVLTDLGEKKNASLTGGTTSPVTLVSEDGLQVLDENLNLSEPLTASFQQSEEARWSPNGELLAYLGQAGSIQIADRRGNVVEESISLPMDQADDLNISWLTDDSLLISSSDLRSLAVDLVDRQAFYSPVSPSGHAQVSASGSFLAFNTSTGWVQVLRSVTPREVCDAVLALLTSEEVSSRIADFSTTTSCSHTGSRPLQLPLGLTPVRPPRQETVKPTPPQSSPEILDRYSSDAPTIIGPLEVHGRYFALSTALAGSPIPQSPRKTQVVLWEFVEGNWSELPPAEQLWVGVSGALNVHQVDLTGDGVDEFFIESLFGDQLWGTVVSFSQGVWFGTSYENVKLSDENVLWKLACNPGCVAGAPESIRVEWTGFGFWEVAEAS